MQFDFDIEKVSKLERKLSVTIPHEVVEKERKVRLQKLAPRVKMAGFRPGKVPSSVVEKNYGEAVLYEVIEEQLRTSYAEILEQEKVQPVAAPKIDLKPYKAGEPINYTALIEVYPEIKLVALDKIKVEKPVAEINDADIDDAILKLRKQYATWHEVPTEIKKDARVTVDIKGAIKDQDELELTRNDFMFVMGDGLMRADFEEHLDKTLSGADLHFKIKYPKDYAEEKLAGNKVEFSVKIKKVEEATLPELNDEFCQKLGVKEGGVAKLREEIKHNMEHHLDEILQKRFKENLLNALLEEHKVELPKALVENEVKRLEERHKKFQVEMQEYAKKIGKETGDMPGALSPEKLKETAERNVGLSLLLQEIIKLHKLLPDPEKVRKRIESLAAAYNNKSEAIDWYYKNKQLLHYVESQILEEQVMEEMQNKVKIQGKKLAYKEAIQS